MGTGPKVLLAHAYYLAHDAKQWRKMKPYPPLATLLAAAVLRARGFDVVFFDAMLAGGRDASSSAPWTPPARGSSASSRTISIS